LQKKETEHLKRNGRKGVEKRGKVLGIYVTKKKRIAWRGKKVHLYFSLKSHQTPHSPRSSIED